MTTLVLGANTVLTGTSVSVRVDYQQNQPHRVGMLWLPFDENRLVRSSPAYLDEPKDWASVSSSDTACTWQLDLDRVFGDGISRIQLVLYAYYDPALAVPACELSGVSLRVNDEIDYQVIINDRHIKTSLILEFYTHKGQYKCRALGEHSAMSLRSFGEHWQVALNEKFPEKDPLAPTTPHRQTGETWTGTAFAIDRHHLLTCHHVIDGANVIGIRQAGQKDREAFVVMSDEGSDTALIRVDEPLGDVLPLCYLPSDLLGESVAVLGFPLSGLTGGLQATTGNIAGLMGLGQDIRFLQFTAPIQAGSSGSPVLLATGEVVAMVTSTLTNTQNMNYAVKHQLLSALLTSAGLSLETSDRHAPMSTPELVKKYKNAVWLVGCGA